MSWLTIVGIISVVLGILAYAFACPYGIHIGVVGIVLTVIGFFIGRRTVAP
jgi:hypothetical protein